MNINDWQKKRLNTGLPQTQEVAPMRPIQKSTIELIKEEMQLKKALNDEQKTTILNNHSEPQTKKVDHTYHQVNSNSFSDVESSLKGIKPFKKIDTSNSTGVSSKAISSIGDETYLARAYHARDNQTTRTNPLSGWGIMTSNSLYHSAGIGNLIESVGMSNVNHNNKSIPVTVVKFAKDHDKASDALPSVQQSEPATLPMSQIQTSSAPPPTIKVNHGADELQIRQIALMDFLTGNYDRHGANILMSKSQGGKRNLLAIDHDQSFSYDRDYTVSPTAHFERSTFARHFKSDASSSHNEEHDSKLQGWWSENKNNILSEINNSLNSITDENTRNFVRKNFNQRFDIINNWSDTYHNNKRSLFQWDSETDRQTPIPLYDHNPDLINRVIESLPERDDEAIEVLSHLLKEHAEDHEKQHMIRTIIKDMAINKMSASDFSRFMGKSDSHEYIKDMKMSIVEGILAVPGDHKSKIKALSESSLSMPEGSNFLTPFLQRDIENALSEDDDKTKAGVA
jgi:hypothetical protein